MKQIKQFKDISTTDSLEQLLPLYLDRYNNVVTVDPADIPVPPSSGGLPYKSFVFNLTTTYEEQTSGLLVIGKEYILNGNAGDDFDNVGATGLGEQIFTATGTTPTVWTNGSYITSYPTQVDKIYNSFTADIVVTRPLALTSEFPVILTSLGAEFTAETWIGLPNQTNVITGTYWERISIAEVRLQNLGNTDKIKSIEVRVYPPAPIVLQQEQQQESA